MTAWQIVSYIVFYIWLFLVPGILLFIWKNANDNTRLMQKTLIDVALKASDAAKLAAEAAYRLAEQWTKPPTA